jgi:hypothetical protein
MSTASRPADDDVTMTSEIHPGRRSTSKFFLHIISSNFSDPITIHHHASRTIDHRQTKAIESNSNPTNSNSVTRAPPSISSRLHGGFLQKNILLDGAWFHPQGSSPITDNFIILS